MSNGRQQCAKSRLKDNSQNQMYKFNDWIIKDFLCRLVQYSGSSQEWPNPNHNRNVTLPAWVAVLHIANSLICDWDTQSGIALTLTQPSPDCCVHSTGCPWSLVVWCQAFGSVASLCLTSHLLPLACDYVHCIVCTVHYLLLADNIDLLSW